VVRKISVGAVNDRFRSNSVPDSEAAGPFAAFGAKLETPTCKCAFLIPDPVSVSGASSLPSDDGTIPYRAPVLRQLK
jgi:hypothetical protein